MPDRTRDEATQRRALYREFREMTEGKPLVDSLRNAALIFGALQTIFFIPADWLLFPDQFSFFLKARLAENALLALVYFQIAKRAPVAGAALVMWSGAALFLAMVHATGGVESGYYVGLILIVIGMGVLAPISATQASWINGLIFAGYTAVPFISHGTSEPIAWPTFAMHAFFLVTACFESILACFHMDRMRFQDFLQKREIERARDELAELDRAKSRFSANVHHELRTPLTLILAPLDALRGREFGELSRDVRHVLDTMHANGRRLYKMINNLLDLSKLESDQLEVVRRPTHVGRLISELVTAAQPLAERKGVTLEIAGFDDAPELNVDPEAIEKVFVNLVGNSLKFTEPGDRVRVEAERIDDGLEIRVVDTGIGIPHEKVDSIFDRFAQVDGSVTRRHEGTGIGLAIAREMVELHGGRIVAESAGLGEGTTVRVWLPPGQCDANAEDEVLQTDSGSVLGLSHSIEAVEADLMLEADEAAAHGDGADPRLDDVERTVERYEDAEMVAARGGVKGPSGEVAEVLIAEDNPDMRALLATLVGRHYRVRAARNGREALEMAREQAPDLVLSDVMMPEMSGTELCQAIKSDPSLENLPVVLVTSKAEDEMKIEGLELGADDYVTKPFHPRELLARIHSLVRVSTLQRALEGRNDQLERTLSELKEAQVQLVKSERLAAVGELAAGIAHEVNNPVNFALNAARAMQLSVEELDDLAESDGETAKELAEAQEVAETIRELSGIVSEGLNRTSVLVADLRDFASGNQGKARSTVSLERGVQSTLHLLGRAASDAGVALVPEIQEGVAFVEGDAGALNQVMLNLVKNAIQAVGEGGHIEVALSGDDETVRFTVRDDGPGIDEETSLRLFEPFFTTKAPGEGTGLGLSISRQIARDHGGDLDVESTPGEGATFTLTLPAI